MKSPKSAIWTTLGQHNDPEQPLLVQYFPKTHSVGKSLLLPYTLMSLVLDFTQMALCVQKHIRMAIIMILNNPY